MVNGPDYKIEIPSLEQIQNERKRIRRGVYYRQALRSTVSVLLVVAAIAVLITTLFMPILQISGDSMSPTLEHDEIIILLVGCVTAFAVSLGVVKFLMSYIKKKDFKLFGIYRIVLGALVLLYFIGLQKII